MRDYYPVVSGAIRRLEQSTVETRRIIYERARAAQVSTLRSVEPPLNDSEIIRERLALKDAIRKVEQESLRVAVANREITQTELLSFRPAAVNYGKPQRWRSELP
jgi:hypothetical protein